MRLATGGHRRLDAPAEKECLRTADWPHPASRGSCRRGHGPSTAVIREIVPAEANARPEEHSDNCTQAAGSQLRPVHG